MRHLISFFVFSVVFSSGLQAETPSKRCALWLAAQDPTLQMRALHDGIFVRDLSQRQLTEFEEILSELLGNELLDQLRSSDQTRYRVKVSPITHTSNYFDAAAFESSWSMEILGQQFSTHVQFERGEVTAMGPLFLSSRAQSVVRLADQRAVDLFMGLWTGQQRLAAPAMDRPMHLQLGPEVRHFHPIEPRGLEVSKMDEQARHRLWLLIDSYLQILPEPLRSRYRHSVSQAYEHKDGIYFRALGSLREAGAPKSFLVQVLPGRRDGFVIEWVAEDGSGERIHSQWRPNP
jgi:hypothetical protein